MDKNYTTRKIIRLDDPVTSTGYKIIHRLPEDCYEIWTQYVRKTGTTPLRNRVQTDEALRLQHDPDGLISYVKHTLINQHFDFYANGSFDPNCTHLQNTPARRDNKITAKKRNKPEVTKSSAEKITPSVIRKPAITPGPKNKQLEALFKEWELAQADEPDHIWKLTKGTSRYITKEHFRRDGIIDEETYAREPLKVLFISAEADDDQYSARTDMKPNTVTDYLEYNRTGYESWEGRMRERLAEMYKVICRIDRNSMSNPEAVLHFAVMDINKRGGGSDMGKGTQVEEYCRCYAGFICREIEIISPDVVAFVGIGLYNMELHTKYLGAVCENGRCFFHIDGRKVPILSLFQTCYYQGRGEIACGYEDNLTVGKQAARCLAEMRRFGI